MAQAPRLASSPIAGSPGARKRLGLAEGRYPTMSQEKLDAYNEEVAALFNDGDLESPR